jgi:hypothetical protein
MMMMMMMMMMMTVIFSKPPDLQSEALGVSESLTLTPLARAE